MCEVRLFAITVPCNSDSGTHIVATCTDEKYVNYAIKEASGKHHTVN